MALDIAFRVRGGDNYGLGHIVRISALVEAFGSLAPSARLTAYVQGPDWVRADLSAKVNCEAVGSDEALTVGRTADLAVLDQLEADPGLIAALRRVAARVAVFSDMSKRVPLADLAIWPQYLGPELNEKNILAGPRYFAMNSGFQRHRMARWEAPSNQARSLLICLGGEAHRKTPEKILSLLPRLHSSFCQITWVTGHGLSNNLIKDIVDKNFCRIIEYTVDFAKLLQQSDMALLAGGFVKWEAACLGVPSILVALTDHQEPLAEALADAGCCAYAGRLDGLSARYLAGMLANLAKDVSQRAAMMRAGVNLVDGRGAKRVARSLLELAKTQ